MRISQTQKITTRRVPPAVAARPDVTRPPRNNDVTPSLTPTVSAEAAGGHGNGRFTDWSPVPGIAPVDGWTMLWAEVEDSDGFYYHSYAARGPDHDVMLPVSRFRFTPSQDRFAFLVRNQFRRSPVSFGPNWDDTEIEAAMALALECAA